ncbi:hypothetical protein OsI_25435 [Oryza sativa Indica Group]|uniref:Uncharacterized protein n=1 Tax=Oryza sativa subsp. indica TaxID=39946 RepID=A2YJM8_ORYSI|nr:hypothetical protein OsI_25435 [Oryza sativa Indica Group]
MASTVLPSSHLTPRTVPPHLIPVIIAMTKQDHEINNGRDRAQANKLVTAVPAPLLS